MFSFKKFIAEKAKGKDAVPGVKGHQPKGYFKGLDKDSKVARAKAINRQKDMSDDDPSAYKKLPGDDKAKTKLSKHTKKVMKMYPSLYKDKNESVLHEDPSSSLKAKSEKSGIPVGILRQVYNRGMAAWKTGHRPGAGQQQWAHARVNSFISKGSGTWGKADKDLAAKARASKKSKKNSSNKPIFSRLFLLMSINSYLFLALASFASSSKLVRRSVYVSSAIFLFSSLISSIILFLYFFTKD